MTNTIKIICILSPLMVTSCATVTRGPKEKFTIESTPSKANVELSNGQKGITPVTFKIKRRGEITVTVKKDGYKKEIVDVPSKFVGEGGLALAGNALIGGLVGVGVDLATGSCYGHQPNPLHVKLKKK